MLLRSRRQQEKLTILKLENTTQKLYSTGDLSNQTKKRLRSWALSSNMTMNHALQDLTRPICTTMKMDPKFGSFNSLRINQKLSHQKSHNREENVKSEVQVISWYGLRLRSLTQNWFIPYFLRLELYSKSFFISYNSLNLFDFLLRVSQFEFWFQKYSVKLTSL